VTIYSAKLFKTTHFFLFSTSILYDGESLLEVSVFSASEMPTSLPFLYGILSALERGDGSKLQILELDVIVFKGGGCPNRIHQEAA